MLKMFHISKQNVAIRKQLKHLLNIFLLIIIKKLLRKSVLVKNIYFICSRKAAMEICFCKDAGENGKIFLRDTFLSYQKRISPMYVFIILQFSRSVRLRRK